MQDKQVELYEVGPRDGLQNEPKKIATTDKIALVNSLNEVGFSLIEATSYVLARSHGCSPIQMKHWKNWGQKKSRRSR